MRSAENIFTEFAREAIAEYQNPACCYCTGKSDLYQDDRIPITVRISTVLNSLEILTHNPLYIPIKYCPMCGRQLRTAN